MELLHTHAAEAGAFRTERVGLVVVPAVVTVYRVRYKRYRANGTHWTQYKRFNSLKAATARIAWWIIGDRYDTFHAYDPPLPGYLPECGCEDNPEIVGQPWEQCPLHNRDDGYFRRLHGRVARWIEKGYLLPGAIQTQAVDPLAQFTNELMTGLLCECGHDYACHAPPPYRHCGECDCKRSRVQVADHGGECVAALKRSLDETDAQALTTSGLVALSNEQWLALLWPDGWAGSCPSRANNGA